MNQRWLQSYITVTECGSINKAAERLYISPQALLQQINSLEDNVGVKLLERTKQGIRLTPAGEEFLKGAREITAIYHTTLNKCKLIQDANKAIRIPLLYGPIYSDYIEAVCNTYLKTVKNPFRIEFFPSPEGIGTWEESLRNLKYDIIEYYAIDGLCPKDIYFEPINKEDNWCLMAINHPLAGKEKITLEDLDSQLIATTHLPPTRYMQLYADNVGIKIKFEVIDCDRASLINVCHAGAVFFADHEIALQFPGLYRAPLDFDMHVIHGLACRMEMKEWYEPFFEVARRIGEKKYH